MRQCTVDDEPTQYEKQIDAGIANPAQVFGSAIEARARGEVLPEERVHVHKIHKQNRQSS